eukprot:TRINITY_DN2375_c2_g3_i1.p1 TRINITY_DN2375_c2_g3~~TRINITY_DN2375_c2_g3_i1.p1  ORF type:complete len:292 (+),score=101.20 TRINITY_DN2375_c2_g3_i1:27-902(+)
MIIPVFDRLKRVDFSVFTPSLCSKFKQPQRLLQLSRLSTQYDYFTDNEATLDVIFVLKKTKLDVSIFSTTTEALKSAMDKFEIAERPSLLSSSSSFEFCALEEEAYNVVQEILKERGYEHRRQEYVLLWPKEVNEVYIAQLKEIGGHGCAPLCPSSSSLVARNWPYSKDLADPETYIHALITSCPSSVRFPQQQQQQQQRDEKEEPAAWIVGQEDGSIGMLHTQPKHRRLGYGRQVAANICWKMLKENKTPFCYILPNNIASLSTFHGLDFKRICNVYWFTITNAKTTRCN